MTIETPGPIRSLPFKYHVEVLTPDQVGRIHEGALQILQRTGIATSSDKLLELMADPGQGGDVSNAHLRFAPDVVEEKRALAPRHFTLAGSRPDRDLAIDGA